MAFCTKCGTQYEAGTAFCGDCGTSVATTATVQPFLSSAAPQARPADDLTTAEMKFIGKNYDYFNRKWKIAELNKRKQSWNWAAFLLAVPWMAYRKMYLYCCIFVGLLGVEQLAEYIFGSPAILSFAISIATIATLGWQGNSLYKHHVQEKVIEITAMNTPEQADIELARQGGTSIGAAIGFYIAALAIIALIFYHKIDFHHAATAPIITTTSPAPTDAAKPSQAGSSDSALSSDSASSNVVSIFPTAVDGFADAASKAAEDADFAKSAASNENYVTRVLNSLSPQDRKIVEIVRNGHQAGNAQSIGKALEKHFSRILWKVSQAGNVTIVEFDGSMIFGELAHIDLSRSSNAQVHLAEIQMQACQNERGCKSLLTSIFEYCDAPERNFPDEASKGTCAQKQVDLIRLQPIPISVKFTVNRADSSFKYASNNWNLTASELSKLIY
jgi:hypothetical protein